MMIELGSLIAAHNELCFCFHGPVD
jgi:hypothetical protein